MICDYIDERIAPRFYNTLKVKELEEYCLKLENSIEDLKENPKKTPSGTFSYQEAADFLRIERSALKQRVRKGKITACAKSTNNPFIHMDDLVKYLVEWEGVPQEKAEDMVRRALPK